MTDHYEEVATALRSHPDAEFGAGATGLDINQAEDHLQVVLPAEYKRFLREFGWAYVPGAGEVYGLGTDVVWHRDLVRVTLSERTEMRPRVPPYLVPILNDGGGNHYCLDTRPGADGECPVLLWDHELGEDQEPYVEARNFSLWLANLLPVS